VLLSRAALGDQGDLAGFAGIAHDGAQGGALGQDHVQVCARGSAFTKAWRVDGAADGDRGGRSAAAEARAAVDAAAVRGVARLGCGRGYDGAHDSVHRFVKEWREERARVPAQAFVPMSFAPGEAYQFDWSHETITSARLAADGQGGTHEAVAENTTRIPDEPIVLDADELFGPFDIVRQASCSGDIHNEEVLRQSCSQLHVAVSAESVPLLSGIVLGSAHSGGNTFRHSLTCGAGLYEPPTLQRLTTCRVNLGRSEFHGSRACPGVQRG